MPEDKVRVSGKSPAQWQRKIALSQWNDVVLPPDFQVIFTELKVEWDEDPNPNNPLDKIGRRKYKHKVIFNLDKGYRITLVVDEDGDPAGQMQFQQQNQKQKKRK